MGFFSWFFSSKKERELTALLDAATRRFEHKDKMIDASDMAPMMKVSARATLIQEFESEVRALEIRAMKEL